MDFDRGDEQGFAVHPATNVAAGDITEFSPKRSGVHVGSMGAMDTVYNAPGGRDHAKA